MNTELLTVIRALRFQFAAYKAESLEEYRHRVILYLTQIIGLLEDYEAAGAPVTHWLRHCQSLVTHAKED